MNKKQRLEKQIKSFTISSDGRLLYEDKLLLDLESKYPCFEHLKFERQIGNGANGVTFLVRHKILNVSQIVKFYFIEDEVSKERALSESRKNSSVAMMDTIARVYDVGEITDPVWLVYSVMEFVNDAITLESYLNYRKSLFNIIGDKYPSDVIFEKDSPYGSCLQESINISIYFLRCIAYLIKCDIRHGDLNPSNIMISGSIFNPDTIKWIEKYESLKRSDFDYHSTSDFSEIVRHLSPIMDNYITHISIGEINQKGLGVKIIDLGSSHVGTSTYEKTSERDSWFVYSTIEQLILPFLESISKGSTLEDFVFAILKKGSTPQVKKIQYSCRIEDYNEIGNYYASKEGNLYKISDGKIELDAVNSDEIENLKNNFEILNNLQVIPHVIQYERVYKGLLFDEDNKINGLIPFQMIAGDLFRLVGIINIIYGSVFNVFELPRLKNFGGTLGNEINNILRFNDLSESLDSISSNFWVSGLFDFKFHETGNILLTPNSKGKIYSVSLFVNFKKFWKELAKFAAKQNMEVEKFYREYGLSVTP